MTLAGTRLGLYEIDSLLGAGGMGEVYRARDTKLGRDVAIKILPTAFSADPERLSRFEREARMLAALNHPHIGAIYGVEESSGVRALVLELIEGQTLGERIVSGPLPVREILAIARQVADALEAAHERGIVHRDLKPANIKVTPQGIVKVLDFGLAKAIDATPANDPSESLTATIAGTRVGLILGTAAYMSPEQARGQAVDKRTDIWAFGCVLYELLTRRRAFQGETVSDTIAAILGRDADWTALPPTTPPSLARLLARCLQKDQRERLRDIGDARLDLQEALAEPVTPTRGSQDTARPRSWTVAAVGAVFLLAAAGAFVIGRGRSTAPVVVEHNLLANATFTRLTDFEGTEHDAAISPDGKWVAFLSDRDGPFDAWLTQVGTARFANLTQGKEDTSGAVRMVGFSGDGSEVWIGGQKPSRRLRLMPLMGGAPRVFLRDHVINVGWSPDGQRLVFHTWDAEDPMFVSDRNGADASQIFISPIAGGHNHYPTWSPDGQWIYFVTGLWSTTEMDVWRIRPSGGEPERLTHHNNNITYPTPIDAHTVVYVAPGDDGSGPWLWALDVDRKTTQRINFGLEKYTSITADAAGRRLVATVANPSANLWQVPILNRLAEDRDVRPFPLPTVRAFAPRFGGGSLFYLSSRGGGDGLWRAQDGQVQELWKGVEGALLDAPATSPDGHRAAILLRRQGKARVHVISADGAELQPLTDAVAASGAACWSPDGNWIVTGGSDRAGPGLFKMPIDGGAPIRLTSGAALNPVWSSDGRMIAYTGPFLGVSGPLLAVDPDGTPIRLPDIQVRIEGERYRFTPGGKSLVYMQGQVQSQDFWLLDLATLHSRPLTHLSGSAAMRTFDITPDGQNIVFDRLRENSDIVLIELPR